MVNIWAEVWPVPGVTPWERRIAKLDAAVLSGIRRGWLGSGSFQVPVRYSRLDEILYKDPDTPANDVESLIRVYMEGISTPVCEFFADQVPNLLADQGVLQFTGYGIESEADKLRVLPFDYSRNPTLDPDWIFGSERNAIRNGGFEDAPLAITNQGFEDGTRAPWWPGAVEGISANAAIVTGANVDTGTFAMEVDPLLAEGGTSTTFRVIPDSAYVVTARFKAAAGKGYQMGASGPNTIIPGSGAILATIDANPGGFEAQTPFTSTGAYQTVTLNFTSAPGQTSTQLSIREASPFDGRFFYVDVVSVSGNGIGVSPWQSQNVTTFQATSTQFDTGAWSGQIVGADANGAGYVFQRMNGFILGATYTATARVRSPVASRRWALEIRDVTGALIAQNSLSLAANTWTSLLVTFEVPLFLPGPDRALEIRIVNYHTASADLFLDTVFLFQGQPATTVGDILIQLMDDANVNHIAEPAPYTRVGKPHITYTSFTAVLDSDGVAWADPDIAITIREGIRYSDFLGDFMRLGYEFELRPDPVTDGEWQLRAYNPGARGTDRTASTHPAIVAGQSTVGGPITRTRIPGNWLFVRGAGGVFDVDTSAGSVTAVGHQEGYVQALDVTDQTTVSLRAAEEVETNVNSGLSLKLKLAPTSDLHSIPLRDFDVGDTLNVTVPEILPKASRRVESIQFTFLANPGDDAALSFDVSFISEAFTSGGGGGGAGSGDVATREAVRRILRKLERVTPAPEIQVVDAPIAAEGGAEMTVSIAASDATEMSRGKADFKCIGVNDEAVFRQVIGLLTPGGKGKLVLSEGIFNVNFAGATYALDFTPVNSMTVEGMGRGATEIHILDNRGNATDQIALRFGQNTAIRDLSIIDDDYDPAFPVTCVQVSGSGPSNMERVNIFGGYGNAVRYEGLLTVRDCMLEGEQRVVYVSTGNSPARLIDSNVECYDYDQDAIYIDNPTRDFYMSGVYIFGGRNHIRVEDDGAAALTPGRMQFTNLNGLGAGESAFWYENDRGGFSYSHLTNSLFMGAGQNLGAYSSEGVVHIVGDPTDNGLFGTSYDTEPGGLISGVTVEGCFALDGFRLVNAHGTRLADCYAEDLQEGHGFVWDGTSDAEAHNCWAIWQQGPDNTYDGFLVFNDSDRNKQFFCTCINDAAAAAGTWRYGFNIDNANCDDNIRVGCVTVAHAAFGTARWRDVGTGSQLVWPGAAAPQGDNFDL